MSQRTFYEELEVIDDEISLLENRRCALINQMETAGSRKNALSNIIRFPSPTGIKVSRSTKEWLSDPPPPAPKRKAKTGPAKTRK